MGGAGHAERAVREQLSAGVQRAAADHGGEPVGAAVTSGHYFLGFFGHFWKFQSMISTTKKSRGTLRVV